MENVRDYLFNKWLMSNKITLNFPGVIITNAVKKYGTSTSISRSSYVFEDIFINLQLDTIKKIGKEQTSKIWYKIGKDSMASYLLLSNKKRPPPFLMEFVLKYILQHFVINGISIGLNMKFNKEKSILILQGKNNIIHRKTEIGDTFAGGVSEVLTFLTGRNIEAETSNCYKNGEIYCKIVCNPNIKLKYIPDYSRLKKNMKNNYTPFLLQEYKKIFLKYSQLSSFNKLLKFKQARIIKNITYFHEKAIVFGEINSADNIIKNYNLVGLLHLLKKTILISSENSLKDLLKNKSLDRNERLHFIQNMMSAFGWGIPTYKTYGDKIVFNFIFGASTTINSFLFYALQLNGFLNYIFSKKLKLIKIKMIKSTPPVSRAIYEIPNS